MKGLLKRLLFNTARLIRKWAEQGVREQQYKKFKLSPSVRIYQVELIGNVEIGEYTYINTGSTLSSGENSKVSIGKYCAIGRYVHITSKTHDLTCPTSDENHSIHKEIEKDTVVGDYVWIGDRVFIKEGLTIGHFAIIATNSVVTRNVEPFEIVGGIPAKHIRYNTEHYRYPKNNL